MNVEALIDALSMGKHGFYVWSAYFLFFLILVGWWVYLKMQTMRLIRDRVLQKNRQIRHEKMKKKTNLDEEIE